MSTEKEEKRKPDKEMLHKLFLRHQQEIIDAGFEIACAEFNRKDITGKNIYFPGYLIGVYSCI